MPDTASVPRIRDVTVVVTCYNHQSYIEQCLDSVLRQSVPVRQVIVIDDCSSDDSADVISRWLVDNENDYTFIRHEKNRGVCATLVEALALAEGTYFCHVSGDDWENDDRFQRQVDAFDRVDENAALLVGDIREVDAGGGTITDHDFGKRLGSFTGSQAQPELLARLLAENVIPAPGTMARTAALREAGGFDETLAFEDYDMWLRLARTHSIAYEPGLVANYRIVDSGLTRNTSRRVSVLSSEADMLAKHIGLSSQTDAIITRRLLPIAGQIMLLDSATGTQHVLELAANSSRDSWLRSALGTSRTRGGLASLLESHSQEFAVTRAQIAAKTLSAPE